FGNYREKIRNAYLLFYERIVHHDESEFQKIPQIVPKKKEEAKEDKPEDNPKEVSSSKKNMKAEDDFIEKEIPLKKENSEIKELNVPKEVHDSIVEKNQIFHLRKYV